MFLPLVLSEKGQVFCKIGQRTMSVEDKGQNWKYEHRKGPLQVKSACTFMSFENYGIYAPP